MKEDTELPTVQKGIHLNPAEKRRLQGEIPR